MLAHLIVFNAQDETFPMSLPAVSGPSLLILPDPVVCSQSFGGYSMYHKVLSLKVSMFHATYLQIYTTAQNRDKSNHFDAVRHAIVSFLECQPRDLNVHHGFGYGRKLSSRLVELSDEISNTYPNGSESDGSTCLGPGQLAVGLTHSGEQTREVPADDKVKRIERARGMKNQRALQYAGETKSSNFRAQSLRDAGTPADPRLPRTRLPRGTATSQRPAELHFQPKEFRMIQPEVPPPFPSSPSYRRWKLSAPASSTGWR